jgi:hypothetical protein
VIYTFEEIRKISLIDLASLNAGHNKKTKLKIPI